MPGPTGKPTVQEHFGISISDSLYCNNPVHGDNPPPMIPLADGPVVHGFPQPDGTVLLFHGFGQTFLCGYDGKHYFGCGNRRIKFIPDQGCGGHKMPPGLPG